MSWEDWSLARALDAVDVKRLEAALGSGTVLATGCVDGGERRTIQPGEWPDYRIVVDHAVFADNYFFGGPPTLIARVISRRSFPAAALKNHEAPSGVKIPSASSSSGEPGYHRVITDVRIRREQIERLRGAESTSPASPPAASAAKIEQVPASRVTEAETNAWFIKEYKADCDDRGIIPTEDDILAAAKTKFGARYRREPVRRARDEFAPDWPRKRGPRGPRNSAK